MLVRSLAIGLLAVAIAGTVSAAGPAGGDTCAAPTALSFPAVAMGSTDGASSSLDEVSMGCLGVPFTDTGGLDHIYSFTLTEQTLVAVDASTPDSDYDLQIYILSTCGDGSSCVAGADLHCAANLGPPTCDFTSDERISRTLAPGTYYLYVDTFIVDDGGNYSIALPEPGPAAAGWAVLAILGWRARRRRGSPPTLH